MAQDPNQVSTAQIRSQIERTRAELSYTIDAIRDRLSPRHVMHNAIGAISDASSLGRAIALNSAGCHICGLRAGANPSRKKASTRATNWGNQSCTSPSASNSSTQPPSNARRCTFGVSGGHASTSEAARLASVCSRGTCARSSPVNGWRSTEMKCSVRGAWGSLRQASQVASSMGGTRFVSETVEVHEQRIQPDADFLVPLLAISQLPQAGLRSDELVLARVTPVAQGAPDPIDEKTGLLVTLEEGGVAHAPRHLEALCGQDEHTGSGGPVDREAQHHGELAEPLRELAGAVDRIDEEHARLGDELPHLGLGLPFHQRLGLRQEVRQEDRVMLAERVVRLDRRDKVAGDKFGSLVDELIERVLAVGARLAPDDRAGLVVDFFAGPPDRLRGGLVIVAGRAEGQVMQPLPGPAVEEHRLALQGRGPQAHRAVAARLVDQPEAAIELLADRLVGNLQRVVQERAHRHVDTSG